MTPFNTPGPRAINIGGIMPVRNLQATLAVEAAAAPAPQAPTQAVVDGLAGHIRKAWEDAKRAKITVEQEMLSALRARRGIYDPVELAKIKQVGGSEIYMMLTSVKCRQAGALLRDTIIGSGAEKPWTLNHSPVPDLPPEKISEIMQEAAQKVYESEMSGMPMDQAAVREMLEEARESALANIRSEAREYVERMEQKMEDQLVEGGFLEALDKFIDDLTTYKTAIIKGPVVRRKNRLKWVGGNLQLVKDFILEWERVDPFNIFPAPHASHIQDGALIERHRLSRGELRSLIGVEGYDAAKIDMVLEDYGRGGLHEWLQIDSQKGIIENKDQSFGGMLSGELIDALQYWGTVQGKLLIEWGMSPDSVPDPLAEYSVEAWLIGRHVIKAVLNPDPLSRRPYYANSYENVPGSFWGNSLYDLIADCQKMCNSAARALANNLGIASGPQVVVINDRLAPGEKITQMYPWKVWQMRSDPMGGTQKAVDFFQPDSNAEELMRVYERFSILADEYSGVPRYMTGTEGTPGAGRTASGLSMMISNATKTIKQVVSTIDIRVLKPLLELLYHHNMRYSDDPELKGDVAIVARGAMSLATKEAAQVRRNEFLVATANPFDMSIIGPEGRANVLREVVRTLDMNVDKVVPPPNRLRNLLAQQAMAQAPQGQPSATQIGGGQQLMNGAPVTDSFQPA